MANHKLLYVDDEWVNLQLFKFSFQDDFTVFLASSGQEALELIKNEQIPVIISDLRMPEMNGIELIKHIKNENSAAVCMLLSAYRISEAIEMGLDEALIERYIAKPWSKADLLEYLNSIFAKLD
ncbi:MAG: response regulator [Salinivirgaceae bacterium]